MRLSELSAETDVPVATIKFYLREGVLPAGRRVSATQADYGRDHVERVRLIRALVEGAGVTLDGVRRVLDAIERPPASRHDFLGEAQQAIDGPAPHVVVTDGTHQAVRRLGWTDCGPGALAHLQAALDTAARAGFAVSEDRLVAYGTAMDAVAAFDIDALEADPAAQTASGALKHVAVGTVVTDAVLVALRRLAQEHESGRRYAPSDAAISPRGPAPDPPPRTGAGSRSAERRG